MFLQTLQITHWLLFFFLLLFLLLLIGGAGRSVARALVLVVRGVWLAGLLTRPLTEPLGQLGWGGMQTLHPHHLSHPDKHFKNLDSSVKIE